MARNAYRAIRTYEAGMDDVFGYCISALTEIGARVRRKDPNVGKIEASVGWHLFIGPPYRFDVTVKPISPDQTKVTVASRSTIRTQFDWGRNKRNVTKFLENMDFIMNRIAVARGTSAVQE